MLPFVDVKRWKLIVVNINPSRWFSILLPKVWFRLIPVLCLPWVLVNWQLPGDGPLQNELQDSGHALAFTLISFCLAHGCGAFQFRNTVLDSLLAKNTYLQSPLSKVKYSLFVLAMSVVIGGFVELIQSGIGREMSAADLLLDALGACAGIALYFASLRSPYLFSAQAFTVKFRLASLAVMSIFLLVSFAETLLCYLSLSERNRTFPLLMDGESFLANRFVGAGQGAVVSFESAPSGWKQNNTTALKLTVSPHHRWPSLILTEPVLSWRGYDALYFEIYSEQDEAININLRVNDTLHNNLYEDRFNQSIVVAPGINAYTFPLEAIENSLKYRALDLGNIAKIVWFVSTPSEPRTFYFDNIKLK